MEQVLRADALASMAQRHYHGMALLQERTKHAQDMGRSMARAELPLIKSGNETVELGPAQVALLRLAMIKEASDPVRAEELRKLALGAGLLRGISRFGEGVARLTGRVAGGIGGGLKGLATPVAGGFSRAGLRNVGQEISTGIRSGAASGAARANRMLGYSAQHGPQWTPHRFPAQAQPVGPGPYRAAPSPPARVMTPAPAQAPMGMTQAGQGTGFQSTIPPGLADRYAATPWGQGRTLMADPGRFPAWQQSRPISLPWERGGSPIAYGPGNRPFHPGNAALPPTALTENPAGFGPRAEEARQLISNWRSRGSSVGNFPKGLHDVIPGQGALAPSPGFTAPPVSAGRTPSLAGPASQSMALGSTRASMPSVSLRAPAVAPGGYEPIMPHMVESVSPLRAAPPPIPGREVRASDRAAEALLKLAMVTFETDPRRAYEIAAMTGMDKEALFRWMGTAARQVARPFQWAGRGLKSWWKGTPSVGTGLGAAEAATGTARQAGAHLFQTPSGNPLSRAYQRVTNPVRRWAGGYSMEGPQVVSRGSPLQRARSELSEGWAGPGRGTQTMPGQGPYRTGTNPWEQGGVPGEVGSIPLKGPTATMDGFEVPAGWAPKPAAPAATPAVNPAEAARAEFAAAPQGNAAQIAPAPRVTTGAPAAADLVPAAPPALGTGQTPRVTTGAPAPAPAPSPAGPGVWGRIKGLGLAGGAALGVPLFAAGMMAPSAAEWMSTPMAPGAYGMGAPMPEMFAQRAVM